MSWHRMGQQWLASLRPASRTQQAAPARDKFGNVGEERSVRGGSGLRRTMQETDQPGTPGQNLPNQGSSPAIENVAHWVLSMTSSRIRPSVCPSQPRRSSGLVTGPTFAGFGTGMLWLVFQPGARPTSPMKILVPVSQLFFPLQGRIRPLPLRTPPIVCDRTRLDLQDSAARADLRIHAVVSRGRTPAPTTPQPIQPPLSNVINIAPPPCRLHWVGAFAAFFYVHAAKSSIVQTTPRFGPTP